MDSVGGGSERCGRCGNEVYSFSKRIAQSDGRYYCVRCAEAVDRNYIIRNSCSVCGRLLSKREVKVVLPSVAYGEEQLPMAERLACASCYKGLLNKSSVARRIRVAGGLREGIRKGIAKSLMAKRAVAAE